MDETTLPMDKTTISDLNMYRADKFRIPSEAERSLGLWVDRIGEGVSTGPIERLRVLGQYCHVIILNGHGVYTSEQWGSHAVKTGDCMVQFPDDPCAYGPNGSWTTRWITWNGPEADRLRDLGYLSKGEPIFRDTAMSISRAYNQLLPIMQRGSPADALRRKTLALQMVLALHDTQSQLFGDGIGQPRIEKALALIHEQFNQNIPIPDIAREVGLSTTHFRRQFREYTGRSPIEYIRDLRMAEAKRLLREGTPIKQVASDVGYEDPFYFMRVFSSSTGTPPGSYVRQHSLHE